MKTLIHILLFVALATSGFAQVQNMQAASGTTGDLTKPTGGFNLASGQTINIKTGATISGAGSYDFSAGTKLIIPNGASPTTTAFGWLAGKNNAWAASRGTLQFFDGTANVYTVAALASSTPTNGQVPTWQTGGTITWTTPATGGVQLGDSPTWTGIHTWTPTARTSGSANYFKINAPADTGLATTVESIGINVVGATRTWVDGTTAVQEEYYFGPPTYNKTTTSAVFTTAATLSIGGPPVAGSGVTLTTALAEWLKLGNLGVGAAGSIATVGPTGTGGLALTASGSNQNIFVTPTGTGQLIVTEGVLPNPLVSSTLGTYGSTQALASISATAYSATAGVSGELYLNHSRGTPASASAVTSGDTLGRLIFGGAISSAAFDDAHALIYGMATENWGASNLGSKIVVATTLTGGTTRTDALVIDNDGSVKALRPLGGLGYAVGAGGAVTQATNRTTGVTLNNVTGAITTNTTSLAALALATFTVTDSAVAVGDCVVVTIRSGTTNTTTLVYVSAVAAGSFNITVDNTNGTTAETGAIIINFAVIKAVSS